MSTFHAVVWMDHSEAHVVMFDREHMEAQRVKSRIHPDERDQVVRRCVELSQAGVDHEAD